MVELTWNDPFGMEPGPDGHDMGPDLMVMTWVRWIRPDGHDVGQVDQA